MPADDFRWDDPGERLLAGLRALACQTDPQPGRLMADALHAFSWRRFAKELAALTASVEPEQHGRRGRRGSGSARWCRASLHAAEPD